MLGLSAENLLVVAVVEKDDGRSLPPERQAVALVEASPKDTRPALNGVRSEARVVRVASKLVDRLHDRRLHSSVLIGESPLERLVDFEWRQLAGTIGHCLIIAEQPAHCVTRVIGIEPRDLATRS